MITALVGHRGTGKTFFLRKLEELAQARSIPGAFLDLDQELERKFHVPIATLFAQGEVPFRENERIVLQELVQSAPHGSVIALGAGFEGSIPDGVHVVWLRRTSDVKGRSFLNRPRLNAVMEPLAEYLERFFVRDRRFRDWAHEELFLPEGYEGGLEEFFLTNQVKFPWDLTLLPENFRNWPAFYHKRSSWQIRHWEIRDDLLDQEQIATALRDLPGKNILFSSRRSGGLSPEGVLCDWALELGEPPESAQIISLHEREDDFDATLAKISAQKTGQLKLAVEVRDFTELQRGHLWWLQDPARRSFMPRSSSGRWQWYRSLFGQQMAQHFIREGDGSSLDQPVLWQTLFQPHLSQGFAAVLGHPIEHSHSPLEHLSYFKNQAIPFVAIDLPEEEFSFAIRFLQQLGLRFAAVTAPLKKLAWALAHSLSAEARQTESANSLYFIGEKIVAHNTDILALKQLRQEVPGAERVWLWGGGGVKKSVKKVWPEAVEISGRDGTDRVDFPELVIWATGRQRRFAWPGREVRPQLILDLNYGDDSPGLEWAVRENLAYQSGLRMFKLQAGLQRDFWSACTNGEWS